MDDFSEQIKQNQTEADKLIVTVDKLYQKLGDLKLQQADIAESGKASTKYYETITALIDRYGGKLDENSARLTKTNSIIGDQERVLASAQSRTELWGKAYEGATGKLGAMGKILGNASAGFKPFTDSVDKAAKVISPFKDAITKANQAYTTYSESMASGKTRFESLKDVFPALAKGIEGGSISMKTFKVALAETGIGLIVIVLAALMEKLQACKPVMDMVNAATAAIGAAMDVLVDTIASVVTNISKLGDFLLHPIDSMMKLGSSMKNTAKDAYGLSLAQEKLKAAMSGQEVINDKITGQIELLKKQADNIKLTAAERLKALHDVHEKEEQYYNQNNALAVIARDNAIKELAIKKQLNVSIIKSLQDRGAEAAAQLLKDKIIDQEQFEAIKKADDAIRALNNQRTTNAQTNADAVQKIQEGEAQKAQERRDKAKAAYQQEVGDIKAFTAEAEKVRSDSATRMALALLQGYDLEIKQAGIYFDNLLKQYIDYEEKYAKANKAYQALHKKEHEATVATIKQLETDKNFTLAGITDKFQQNDLQKLEVYRKQLTDIAARETKNATELVKADLIAAEKEKADILKKAAGDSKNRGDKLNRDLAAAVNISDQQKIDELEKEIATETKIQEDANNLKTNLEAQLQKDLAKINADAKKAEDEKAKLDAEEKINKAINGAHNTGHWQQEFKLRQQQLDAERNQAVAAAQGYVDAVKKVEEKFDSDQRKLNTAKHMAQLDLQKQYLGSVSTMSAALGNIFGKNTVAAKAAFKAHQAAAAGQVIIDTEKSVMGIWSANSGLPFIGVAKAVIETAIAVAAGASSLSNIVKQKPGFAQGGQFHSDGRGALLPGFSRTDDTNAYLRSGEAVVVSEAMRNPWARNLVSAINVAHGGRDFSVANPGRGYAIGGVFTDGGNANRYYSQPVTDVKDLANTLAYQMVNNFPPIYVDVKDVNNQQNILAQTVNRVNL